MPLVSIHQLMFADLEGLHPADNEAINGCLREISGMAGDVDPKGVLLSSRDTTAHDLEHENRSDPGPPVFDKIPLSVNGPLFYTRSGSWCAGGRSTVPLTEILVASEEDRSTQADVLREATLVEEGDLPGVRHLAQMNGTLEASYGTTVASNPGTIPQIQRSDSTHQSYSPCRTRGSNVVSSINEAKSHERQAHPEHVATTCKVSPRADDDRDMPSIESPVPAASPNYWIVRQGDKHDRASRLVIGISVAALAGSGIYLSTCLQDHEALSVPVAVLTGSFIIPTGALGLWYVTQSRRTRTRLSLLPVHEPGSTQP